MHALAMIAWAALAGSTSLTAAADDDSDATDRDALSLLAESPAPENAVPAADFNRDGIIDIFDYIDFANAFAMADTCADIDESGDISDHDASDFALLWATTP